MAKRRYKKVRQDGRRYDGATAPPLGCCTYCWHESGAEVRSPLYAIPPLGMVLHLCFGHWVWLKRSWGHDLQAVDMTGVSGFPPFLPGGG
ncbi:MAG: hypothetical protein FJ206_12305 [Gemmatimonadetes bacterium]|nr:hypothetical protein [Gemmatimonadota bacterium]